MRITIRQQSLLLGALIWIMGVGSAVQELFAPRILLIEGATAQVSSSYSTGAIWLIVSRLVTVGTFYFLSPLAIVYGLYTRKGLPVAGLKLWLGVILFTLGPLVASVMGTTPGFDRKLLFVPVIFTAAYLQPNIPLSWFVSQVKLVLLVYAYGSLIAGIVAPSWAFDFNYTSSMIPGLNIRLAGLTPQANALAPLQLLYLILEIFMPTKGIWKWPNLLSVLLVFTLCQSKTSWSIMMIALAIKVAYEVWQFPKKQFGYVFLLSCGLIVVFFVSLHLVLTEIDLSFISQDRMDSITTLTGRTTIWEFTLEAWKENPWFGYGPHIWNPEFRLQFGKQYLWAGQAHNQFIQALGEAGIFGLALLLIYLCVLVSYAFRYLKFTRGISIALIVFPLIRSITETPLRNYVIDQAFFTHFVVFTFLLLLTRQTRKPIQYEGRANSDSINLS